MTSRNPGKGRFGVYRGKQLVGTEHDRDKALSGARIVKGTHVRDSETGRDYEPDRHHPQVAWTNPSSPRAKAEKFFYDYAGYSYDPKNETQEQGRRRAAKQLAAAEAWASAEGYTFEWEHDPEPWEDMFEHPDDIQQIRDGNIEVFVLTMRDPRGDVRQSLGAIGLSTNVPDARRDARVFEAELALEEYNLTVHRKGPIGPKSTRR